MTVNYYEFLSLAQTASTDEISRAISSKERELKQALSKPNTKDSALRDLEIIDRIKEILLNPEKRKQYDQSLTYKQESLLQCPHCGRKNPTGSRYCINCGMAIVVTEVSHPTFPVSIPSTSNAPPSFVRPGQDSLQGSSKNQTSPPIEVKRYGRIEYFTPMDKYHEYPLRVGLLLDRRLKDKLQETRIHWMTLFVAAKEEEPSIRIIPSSAYFQISPPMWDIKVKKYQDIVVDFRLLPMQIPDSRENRCNLQVDFVYSGEVIKSVCLDVKIQEKFKLGPIYISNMHWKRIGVIGGLITAFDTAASLFDFFSAQKTPNTVIAFSFSFIVGVLLILTSFLLWQKAGKSLRQIF